MLLKSETKNDRKPAVKITLQYKLSSAFCEKEKIARKNCLELKREIFRFAVFWRGAHRFWSKQAEVTAVWNLGFLWQNEAFLYNFSEYLLENPPRYICTCAQECQKNYLGEGSIFDILFLHLRNLGDWVWHAFIMCYDSWSRDTTCHISPSFLGGRMLWPTLWPTIYPFFHLFHFNYTIKVYICFIGLIRK